MSNEMLGSSKIAIGMKISLIKSVAQRLGVKRGDFIIFKRENGRIYIEKG
ncbi:MAG: AbrB/MazE/SpoVT family DNA-binding domain-containing protein [Methanosarcinales archaeon]|nr:MAG: AbrB/MazE/SpoVT family DNA-binding domain-containing protein [Methanosarcinales archaeon]